MVGNYTKTMKKTFEFNFDLNYAVKQHGYTKTKKSSEFIIQKSFSLIKFKLNCKSKHSLLTIKSRLYCSDIIAYHRS